MKGKVQYIDLQDYGFDALELQSAETPAEKVFEELKKALSQISVIQDLSSYKAIIAEEKGIDSVGAVNQINEEAKKQGYCLLFL